MVALIRFELYQHISFGLVVYFSCLHRENDASFCFYMILSHFSSHAQTQKYLKNKKYIKKIHITVKPKASSYHSEFKILVFVFT